MIPNPYPSLVARFERVVEDDGQPVTQRFDLRVLGFNPGSGTPLVLTNGSNPELKAAESFVRSGFTYVIEDTSQDDVVAYLPGGAAAEYLVDGQAVAGIASGFTVHRDGSVRPLSLLKPATTTRTILRDEHGDVASSVEEVRA